MARVIFLPGRFYLYLSNRGRWLQQAGQGICCPEAEIIGVSVDSLDSHRSWADELGGIDYPLLSDEEKTLSRAYGVLDKREGVPLRATFIINPNGEVSYLVISHVNVGRSVEETLRVLKALRTERLCPSEWKPGEPTGGLDHKY
jgi:peroxiredoxin 2/4